MIKPRLFLLSTLAVVSACTTLPEEAPSTVLAEPNVPMVSAYDIAPTDLATTSGSLLPSIATTRWQDFYDDSKLKALIALGLENNKNLEQATLAIRSSAAQYQISRANALPTVNVGSAYERGNKMAGAVANQYSVQLGMTAYEIDLWGRIASLKEQALQSYWATHADKDTVQIGLIANIATAYVNLSYALAQLQLAQSTAQSREHSLLITQKRFEAGLDSKSPSLQAESSLEMARLAVMGAQTQVLKAQNVLQLLIGVPVPLELMPDSAIKDIANGDVFNAGLPSELLLYRPDIVSAEHKLKSAGANINVARAAYFPQISLGGALSFGSSSINDLFRGNVWSFGPSVHLPIFDGGARHANYEMAQVAQQQALVSYELAIQTAFKEVKDVFADRANIDQQIHSQYKLQDNYQQTFNIAYASYQAGLSDYLSVLDAERSLFANQQQILSLEQQKVISQIELYKVLGGGATLNNANADEQSVNLARIATEEEVVAGRLQRISQLMKAKPVADEPLDKSDVDKVSLDKAIENKADETMEQLDYLPKPIVLSLPAKDVMSQTDERSKVPTADNKAQDATKDNKTDDQKQDDNQSLDYLPRPIELKVAP